MNIDPFRLERVQSIWENQVDFNLSESGIHPLTLKSLLGDGELEEVMKLPLSYGQTNGDPGLRALVGSLYPETTEHEVLITNGSAEANFLSCFTLLQPGDELIVMHPNYMQVHGIAKALGVVVRTFPLVESRAWAPNLDALAEMVTPKTRMIAVCNPNNPTGAVMKQNLQAQLVAIASEVGAWILSDEVYRGAELNGKETVSFRGLYDRVLAIGGLSKAYALPGLRLGWVTGPKETIEKLWATRDYTTITTNELSEKVASYALQPAKRAWLLERNRTWLRGNFQILQAWLGQYEGVFHMVPPQATGVCLVRYTGLGIPSAELTEQIRKEQSVLLIAGSDFGLENYLRFGFGAEPDYLQQALARVSETLKLYC